LQGGFATLNRDESHAPLARGYYIGKEPKDYPAHIRPPVALYLPGDPSHNRLRGTGEDAFPLMARIVLILFAVIGVGIIVNGIRGLLPVPSALLNADVPLQLRRPVALGILIYTPRSRATIVRPTWWKIRTGMR
jgi:hypothetical protein